MIEVKLNSDSSNFFLSEYNFTSILNEQVFEKFDLKEKSGYEIVAETKFALNQYL